MSTTAEFRTARGGRLMSAYDEWRTAAPDTVAEEPARCRACGAPVDPWGPKLCESCLPEWCPGCFEAPLAPIGQDCCPECARAEAPPLPALDPEPARPARRPLPVPSDRCKICRNLIQWGERMLFDAVGNQFHATCVSDRGVRQ